MLTFAEVRWFWRGHCPEQVRDWFFKTGLSPGGGLSRIFLWPNLVKLEVRKNGNSTGLLFACLEDERLQGYGYAIPLYRPNNSMRRFMATIGKTKYSFQYFTECFFGLLVWRLYEIGTCCRF